MTAKHQRGISLLEILLVLTVAAGIVTAAIAYFTQTLRSNKVSQAVSLIQQINKAGYEWLQIPGTASDPNQYQQDFSNLSQAKDGNGLNAFIDLNLISCANNSCFTNPWGGPVIVSSGSPAKYMMIMLNGIPAEDCTNLQQAMQNIAPTDPSLVNQNSCTQLLGSKVQVYEVFL